MDSSSVSMADLDTTLTYTINHETGLLEPVSVDSLGAGEYIEFTEPMEISEEGAVQEQQQFNHHIGHEVEVVSVDPTSIPRPFLTTNKPSLLRRGPRTTRAPSHVTAYPPQISQSVLSRYGQINNKSSTSSPTTSYLSGMNAGSSPSKRPTVSSIFYDRKAPIINTKRAINNSLTVAGGQRAIVNSRNNEEIIIWQPDDQEDVEVLEVDEEQLQQIFKHEPEQGQEDEESEIQYQIDSDSIVNESDMQQIIVCGDGQNIELNDLLQNYMIEVVNSQVGSGNRKNRRNSKVPSKRKEGQELKCLEEGCNSFVHNVIDLRKHLQNNHMFELDEEVLHFSSDDDFKTWRANYERDRKVSFIYRGGTKKISPEKAVTYLICHRSGVYKPTPRAAEGRKRKMKPQGSCKIGTHCTAGVKLLKNLINGSSEATVCHTHYGHELENLQHLRVNSSVKDFILQKFEEGMTFTGVLQYVHHNPDGLEGLRLVDRRAIRNIYDQWKKNKELPPVIKLNLEGAEDEEQINEVPNKDPIPEEPNYSVVDQEEGETQNQKLETPDSNVKNKRVTRSSGTAAEEEKKVDAVNTSSSSKCEQSVSDSHITPADDVSEDIKIKIERTESLAMPGTETVTSTTTGTGITKTKKKKASSKPIIAQPFKSIGAAIHQVVEKLLDHGESGPTVLFYKKAGNSIPIAGEETSLVRREDMCVILQTPVQRQLLQMFGKIIFIDVISGNDVDVMVLAIFDEFLTAIPVVWMITPEVTDNLIELCFQHLKDNCVEVKCDYFFSHKIDSYHKLWCNAFGGKKPRLLFTQEDSIKEFGLLVKRHIDDIELRNEITKYMETLVVTPDRKKFEDILKILKTKSPTFLKTLNKDWLLNKSQWAFHARLQIPFVIEDSFSRLKKFILFKGTRRLSKNVDNILKIGYDRCFQRNKSLFKGDLKYQQIVESIQTKHNADQGKLIRIEKINDIKYLVEGEFEVFDLHTECKCKYRCEFCGVCAHRFWCTCEDNPNFCSHAHQVCIFSKPNLKTETVQLTNELDSTYSVVV